MNIFDKAITTNEGYKILRIRLTSSHQCSFCKKRIALWDDAWYNITMGEFAHIECWDFSKKLAIRNKIASTDRETQKVD